jgi:hypothetical protein
MSTTRVKRIHNNLDQKAVVAEAAKLVGYDNEFLLVKVVLDRVANDSVKELQPRWINRLAGVDVWTVKCARQSFTSGGTIIIKEAES